MTCHGESGRLPRFWRGEAQTSGAACGRAPNGSTEATEGGFGRRTFTKRRIRCALRRSDRNPQSMSFRFMSFPDVTAVRRQGFQISRPAVQVRLGHSISDARYSAEASRDALSSRIPSSPYLSKR